MALPPWTRELTRDLMSGSFDEVASRLKSAVSSSELSATALRGLDRVLRETKKNAEQFRRWVQTYSSLSHSTINASGIYFHPELIGSPLSSEQLHSLLPGEEMAAGNLPEQRQRIDRQFQAVVDAQCGAAGLVAHSTEAALAAASACLPKHARVVLPRCFIYRPDGTTALPELLAATGTQILEIGTAHGCVSADWHPLLNEPADTLVLVQVLRPDGAKEPSADLQIPEQLWNKGLKRLAVLPYGCWQPLPEPCQAAGLPVDAKLLKENWLTIVPGNLLLGGPRSALILGSPTAIATVRSSRFWPLAQADLGTVAALTVTLRQTSGDPQGCARLTRTSAENLQGRAERLATQLAGSDRIAECQITSEPARLAEDLKVHIPSRQLLIQYRQGDAAAWQNRLREQTPALLTTEQDGQLVIDFRWLPPRADDRLASLLCGETNSPAPTPGTETTEPSN